MQIENLEVSKHWEKLVEKHMSKMRPTQMDNIGIHNLVVLNHPISFVHANAKLMSMLSRIKPLTRNDHQMLACYYHKDLPMKMELNIKDGGVTVGTYKIYILGTRVHQEHVATKDIPNGFEASV